MSIGNQIFARNEQGENYLLENDYSVLRRVGLNENNKKKNSHSVLGLVVFVLLIIGLFEGINRMPINKLSSSLIPVSETPSLVMRSDEGLQAVLIEKYLIGSTPETLHPAPSIMNQQSGLSAYFDDVLVDIVATVAHESYVEKKHKLSTEEDKQSTKKDSFLPVIFEKQNVTLIQEQQEISFYDKAVEHLRSGRNKEAIILLNHLLEDNPKHIEGRLLLVAEYLNQGGEVTAKELLTRGLGLFPDKQQFSLPMAHILVSEGKVSLAIKVLEKAKSIPASNPEYFSFIAALKQRNGEHKAAVEMYKKILEINPDNGKWWLGMAISLLAQGQNNDALFAFKHSLSDVRLTANLREYAIKIILDLQKRDG